MGVYCGVVYTAVSAHKEISNDFSLVRLGVGAGYFLQALSPTWSIQVQSFVWGK